MIVLSRDDRITLLDFTDTSDSRISAAERETWASLLKSGVALGNCSGQCPEQLLAVHYNLENSLLSIATENAERDLQTQRFHEQPEGGSSGLMLRNQLNLNGGQNQDLGGRFGLEASASLGNWSQAFNMQLARSAGRTPRPIMRYTSFTPSANCRAVFSAWAISPLIPKA